MKAYHEKIREQEEKLSVQFGQIGAFPTHFHNNLEIYLLKSGEREIFCNGKSYLMRSGSLAFFDSYDFHGYGVKESGVQDVTLIIPYKYAERFNAKRNNLRAENPVLSSQDLTNRLYELVTRLFKDEKDDGVLIAGVELFLAMISTEYQFTLTDYGKDNELIRKILYYIGDNFRSEITLSGIAKEFGYSVEHVSRVFHKYLKTGIPEYVNGLRLNCVEQLVKAHPEKKITEIIFDSGFNSIQSYYRNKARKNS